MREKISLLFFTGVLFALGFFLSSNTKLSTKPRDGKKGARIVFASETLDLGVIREGDIVDGVFSFSNAGDDTLKIQNVKASCGCTAALLSSDIIPPNGKGEIKATFNSRGKVGNIHKTITVFSNSADNPVTQLNLVVKVEGNGSAHTGGMKKSSAMHPEVEGDMHGSYFEGKCANCHVEPGVGKFGKDLFDVSCAMCHGADGRGAVAQPLRGGEFLNRADASLLQERIAKGSPSNVMMRGFAKSAGGPLDEAQIKSLVEYIGSWKHK